MTLEPLLSFRWSDDPAEIVNSLDSAARSVLLTPGIDELASHLSELDRLPVFGHPWAGLVVCEAISNAVGPAAAADRLERARSEFDGAGDEVGLGFCCAFDGLNALSTGHLADVAPALDASRAKLGPQSPRLEHLLAASAWSSYEAGDLAGSIAVAEEALSQACIRANRFGEGVAWFHIGYFCLWTGDFRQAELALRFAAETLNDESLFEHALTCGAQGVLASLRAQDALAEACFHSALTAPMTQARGDRWLESVFRALRAEFTASIDAERALNDAREARAALLAIGDTWWVNWALLATAVALGAAGQRTAAERTFDELLGAELRPLERARAHLRYGEMLLDLDDREGAQPHLADAAEAFETANARYWAVRAMVGLLATQPRTAAAIRRRAQALGAVDPAYSSAWRGSSRIDVRVLGAERVTVDRRTVKFPTVRAEAGFFQLALAAPHSITKEALAASLWPDASATATKANVQTLLWQIRRALGRAGERLHHDQIRVAFDIDREDIDLHRLTNEPSSASPPVIVLPKFAYEEWVQPHQHRLDVGRCTNRS